MPLRSERQILAAVAQIGMASRRGLPIDLLSPTGRIIAALMQNDVLTVKDIPHLAGISFRSCFDQLSKLEGLGIIERRVDPSDKRRLLVALNQEKLLAGLKPTAPKEGED
jgi:DNA-binding MarR family transcriptional regulator